MEWQQHRQFTVVGHRCGRYLVVIVLLMTCAATAVAQPSRVNPAFDSYMQEVAWSDIAPSPTLRLQGGDDPREIQGGDDSKGSCLDWILPRSPLPLPFLRGLAEGSGATLPPPIGTSFVSTELNRSVGVNNLRVWIGGNPPQPVNRFSVGDLSAHASSQIFRLDGWLFPFLNVYGVVGRTKSTGHILATVEEFPFPSSPSFSFPININLNGVTYGAGGTLAMGTPKYYATLDMNYTLTDFTAIDNELSALVLTPRLGAVVMSPLFKGAVHIGAMYQDTAQKVYVTVDDTPVGPIEVSLDQYEPKPWNFLVGALWGIDERIHLVVELGMGGRNYVISALTVRF